MNFIQVCLDLLSIPATSTPSERLFSQAGLLSKDKFGRINPETLEARVLGKINCLTTQEWLSLVLKLIFLRNSIFGIN